MKNKKSLLIVFIGLTAISIAGLVWVTNEIKKNNLMVGKLVATLPTAEHNYRWLTNDRILCSELFVKFTPTGYIPTSNIQIIDVRSGTVDSLPVLRAWLKKRIAINGLAFEQDVRMFSPDGKWLYSGEVQMLGKGAGGTFQYTNRHWLLSLDGSKQIPFKSDSRLIAWLPDNSGFNVIWMHGFPPGMNLGKNARSLSVTSVVKLNELNREIPLPKSKNDMKYDAVYSPDGKHSSEIHIVNRRQGNITYLDKIVSVQVKIRNAKTNVIEFESEKLPEPEHLNTSIEASCLPAPTGDKLLWTFVKDNIKMNFNSFSDIFHPHNQLELIVTDNFGKNERRLPIVYSDQFFNSSGGVGKPIQWLPNGKSISYQIGKKVYKIDLDR